MTNLFEPEEIEFTLKHLKRSQKFRMRELSIADEEDCRAKSKTVDKTGKTITNDQELWAQRLYKSLLEPKLTLEQLRSLPAYESTALRAMWTELNFVSDEDFLALKQKGINTADKSEQSQSTSA